MTPSLPIEVEEQIIDYLGSEVGPDHKTLASCALTCKAWVPRSRIYLFQRVSILDVERLYGLSSLPFSPSHPIPDSVQQLWSLESHSEQQPSFGHLVPHFLATRLPNVQHLQLGQRPYAGVMSSTTPSPELSKTEKPFPYHATLLPHLARFRNVTRLNLDHYHFDTYSDVRRFIGAFPALTRVTLQKITWGRPTTIPARLYRSTAWNLTYIFLFGCQDDTLGLWLWIVPPSMRSRERSRFDDDSQWYRGIGSDDAFVMSEVLKAIIRPNIQGFPTGFQTTLKKNEGKKIATIISDQGNYGSVTFTLSHTNYVRATNGRPVVDRGPSIISGVHLAYNSSFTQLKGYKWEDLGTLLCQFVHLDKVKIEVSSNWWEFVGLIDLEVSKEEVRTVVEIASLMPSAIRDQCTLEFIVKGNSVPWRT